MCREAYEAALKSGAIVSNRSVPIETRFWQRVEKAGGDACWRWTGPTDGRGYGVAWFWHSRRAKAHRPLFDRFAECAALITVSRMLAEDLTPSERKRAFEAGLAMAGVLGEETGRG